MFSFAAMSCCPPLSSVGSPGAWWIHRETKEEVGWDDCECRGRVIDEFAKIGFVVTREEMEEANKAGFSEYSNLAFYRMDKCKEKYHAVTHKDYILFWEVYGKCMYEKGYLFYPDAYYCCYNRIACKVLKKYSDWLYALGAWYWFY